MWNHQQWFGRLFPVHTPQEQCLNLYAKYLNSIEGNTSFYSLPSAHSIQRWDQATHENFRFTFKFPQSISHQQALNANSEDVSCFLNRFAPIAHKISCLMLQLPASFSPQQLPQLQHFLQALPQDFNYGVEVRHLGFFDKGQNEKRFNQLLMQHNCNRVIMDTRGLFACAAGHDASIRDAQTKKPRLPVHAIATGDQPIVRFVGHPVLQQNPQYYKPWLAKLNQWQQQGKQPHIFFHSADNADAPWMAEMFFKQMRLLYPQTELPNIALPQVQQEQFGMF